MVSGGLRERRRVATRREIARAALDLVAERGLAAVTVDDIADAAGVSTRTFFNYFPSKRSAVIPGPQPPAADAVERFVADRRRPVLDGLVALLVESAGTWIGVRREVETVQRVLRAHPELVPVLQERIAEFESVLADAVARRLGAPVDDPRPQVAAAVAGTLLRISMTRPDDESLATDLTRAYAALKGLL